MTTIELVELPQYRHALQQIVAFLGEQDPSGIALDAFLAAHEHVLTFITSNSWTPAIHPVTGDQTWPFGDGRYRIFFRATKKELPTKLRLVLADVIVNRRANVHVYPSNQLPSYDTDE